MRRILELDWRQDRIEHIRDRHGITPEEVEQAVFDDPKGLLVRVGLAERNPRETIYRHLGRTAAGRFLLVALLYTGHGVAIPLTARDMDDAERRRYTR